MIGMVQRKVEYHLPCSCAGCPTGNGEKRNMSQAEQSQAINLAVAYFTSISCGASYAQARYIQNMIIPVLSLPPGSSSSNGADNSNCCT